MKELQVKQTFDLKSNMAEVQERSDGKRVFTITTTFRVVAKTTTPSQAIIDKFTSMLKGAGIKSLKNIEVQEAQEVQERSDGKRVFTITVTFRVVALATTLSQALVEKFTSMLKGAGIRSLKSSEVQ